MDSLKHYAGSTAASTQLDQLPTHKMHEKPGCIWTRDCKIIKFTGDMNQNIDSLMRGLQCRCACRGDFQQMLNAFGDKIVRLREQRDRYKENASYLKRHIETMQLELSSKSKDIETLEENYFISRRDSLPKAEFEKKYRECQTALGRSQELQRKNAELTAEVRQLREQCLHLSNKLLAAEKEAGDRSIRRDQTFLLQLDSSQQSDGPSLRYPELRQRVERYQKLFRQLPMQFEEAAKLLRDYVADLPPFATKQQRQLYFMATKMNSSLWKRKVQIEIKDLCERREVLKKLQGEANSRRRNHKDKENAVVKTLAS